MSGLRLLLALLLASLGTAMGWPQTSEGVVFEVVLHDTLQPVSAKALQRAVDLSRRHDGSAVLINLSTPGGLAASAGEMIQAIEGSPVPVIVFCAQPGTRISGEGIRVLAAGDIAAMTPGSYLTPLLSDLPRTPHSKAAQEGEASALEASVAQLSQRHGRSGALARRLAGGQEWVSAEWARQDGFVDVEARDEAELLSRLDGRTVMHAGRRVTLHLSGARLVLVQPTLGERLMRALMNPDLTVLLLTLGGLLIYLEFNTPGTVLPGATGLLLVMLAVYALHLLPLRTPALLLLAGSGVLLLLETRFQRHGALAAVGVCLLPLGLATLVAGPIRELEVGWATAIGAGLGFGGVTAMLLLLGLQARRAKRRTGAEAMLGWLAVAQTALTPEGRVLVRGELWKARLTSTEVSVEIGTRVRVLRAEGHVLEVTAMGRVQEA